MSNFEKYLKKFNLKPDYTEAELNKAYKRLTIKYRYSPSRSEVENKKYNELKEGYKYLKYYLNNDNDNEAYLNYAKSEYYETHSKRRNENLINFLKVLLFLICLVAIIVIFHASGENLKNKELTNQETVNQDLRNKKINTYNQNNNNTSGINSIIPPTELSDGNNDYHFDKRDFDNYMDDLGNKLQKNWFPPENSFDTAVTVSIDIAKDGRLLNVAVKKSSGVLLIDTSAINAVKASAPFNPLPPNYKGDSINIHFTFDYNNYQKNWII